MMQCWGGRWCEITEWRLIIQTVNNSGSRQLGSKVPVCITTIQLQRTRVYREVALWTKSSCTSDCTANDHAVVYAVVLAPLWPRCTGNHVTATTIWLRWPPDDAAVMKTVIKPYTCLTRQRAHAPFNPWVPGRLASYVRHESSATAEMADHGVATAENIFEVQRPTSGEGLPFRVRTWTPV